MVFASLWTFLAQYGGGGSGGNGGGYGAMYWVLVGVVALAVAGLALWVVTRIKARRRMRSKPEQRSRPTDRAA